MDDKEFGERAKYVIKEKLGGTRPAARRLAMSTTMLESYMAGKGDPSRSRLLRMAEEGGVDLLWLATGRGEPDAAGTGFVYVPRYDAKLSAGAGSWNEGRKRLDEIPFTERFLRRRLNRSSVAGLSVVEARGDSMEPTIADGALLLIDERQNTIDDGVFAFVLNDVARVKRFLILMDAVRLISDNPAYAPETIIGEDQAKLQVIGRVVWVGQCL